MVCAKRSLQFGSTQNAPTMFGPCRMVLDIWSYQKHPCLENILGFKQPIKFISISVLQNQYIKTTIMFYWSNNCVVAALLIITLLALVAELVMAHGVR